jgi:hypothetical protein
MPFKDPNKQLEYMRQWRINNKQKTKEDYKNWSLSAKGKELLRKREERLTGTTKAKARLMIKNRLNRKKMPHPSFFLCTDCDQRATHYHHEDYSLWWSIEPLCHTCHGKRHRKQ